MLNNFASLRICAGLSVEDVALMTGYSSRQVQRWEPDRASREQPRLVYCVLWLR